MIKDTVYSIYSLKQLPKDEIERLRKFYLFRTRRREKLIFNIAKKLNVNILQTSNNFDEQTKSSHKICDVGFKHFKIRDLVSFLKFAKDLGLSTILLCKDARSQQFRYYSNFLYNFYTIKDNVCYHLVLYLKHLDLNAPLYTFDKNSNRSDTNE